MPWRRRTRCARCGSAVLTHDPALRIHQRRVMRGPRQVVPGPIAAGSHPTGASAASAAGVAPHSSAFDVNLQATALGLVHRHDSKSRQPENPRTIAPRSHRSSLVGCTSRENTIRFWMATWDRFSSSRPPSKPPTPAAVRAGGRVLPHQIDKSKKLTYRDDRSLDNAPNTSGVVSRWNR